MFTKYTLALGLFALSVLGVSAKTKHVFASSYGILPNKSQNVAPLIHKLIEQESRGLTEQDTLLVSLDYGRFYFDAKDAPTKEVYISNHDQVGQRSIGILIEGKQNIILMGNQSELIFRDRMLPIAIIGSKGISLRGLSIDFVEPQISQVEVIDNKGKEGGITFRPAEWVKWRINDQQRFEAFGSNWSNVPETGIVFNKDNYHTAYRISDLIFSTEGVRDLGGGLLNAPKWADERLKPGMIVAMRGWGRPNPAIFIDNSERTHCENVNVHYADGMGLLAQNSHNVHLSAFNVARRGHSRDNLKGSADPRYFTAQADATHFSGCSGKIIVEHSLFEHMMDDAINVHGLYLKLTKRIDDYTLEGQYMHTQAWGFEWGRVGDPVQFVYSKTFDCHPTLNSIASIEAVDKPSALGAKVFRIRFTKRVPRDIKPETQIGLENMRKVAGVVFANNVIRNNRARGTLFNTPEEVIVTGNHFDQISGAAIVASTDCNQWFESGQTQKLKITDNLFTDVLTSLYQFTEAVITLHPVIPEPQKQRVPFYGGKKGDITIERNVFRTFDTPLLFARSVKGLVWSEDNVIEPTTTYPKYHWNQEVFKLEYCKDISLPTNHQ